MNQNLSDLEEGEIADDIISESMVEKKIKTLPRRYTLNERKSTPKHKRSCKHASQHHTRNNIKSKFSKKHRKVCPKHKVGYHGSLLVNNFNLANEKSYTKSLNDRKLSHDSQKQSSIKSAFKNFTSPPRKVSKLNKFSCSPEKKDSFPKLLNEYKNSRGELKFKNISNLKKQDKNPCKTLIDKDVSKQESSENLPPVESSTPNSDDEDEEELRRIALATCSKRVAADVAADVNSGETKSSNNLNSLGLDNYEVVDMEIDEESENVENVNNLFVIDTTPTYFGELHQQTVNNFGYNLGNEFNTGIQNGFISTLNIEEPFQNFNSNVINHDLNNDLYLTNFSPILVNESNPSPNQLDDDVEEELLRAKLIANINSVRKKAEPYNVKHENIAEHKICLNQTNLDIENKIDRNENTFKGIRTINVKNDIKKDLSFNERIVSIESKISEIESNFNERSVSIVNDCTKKENSLKERTKNISTLYSKHDSKTINVSKRSGVDIKVKLNNVSSSSINPIANRFILPQERIIISLNNDSSSDDSDQEDASQENHTAKDSAVASLEALISNARHESDGKKESVANSNASSDALSWLSKAQQEEYNSLMKILAKKQQTTLQTPQNEIKKAEAAGLTLLKKKMFIARKNLEKEKELMNNITKDLAKKKRAYMLSKLRTQHLKEQLLAAERVRKSNLQLWTKCSSELQTLKKSVSKRQAIINSLESKITLMCPGFDTNNVLPVSNHTPDSQNLSL